MLIHLRLIVMNRPAGIMLVTTDDCSIVGRRRISRIAQMLRHFASPVGMVNLGEHPILIANGSTDHLANHDTGKAVWNRCELLELIAGQWHLRTARGIHPATKCPAEAWLLQPASLGYLREPGTSIRRSQRQETHPLARNFVRVRGATEDLKKARIDLIVCGAAHVGKEYRQSSSSSNAMGSGAVVRCTVVECRIQSASGMVSWFSKNAFSAQGRLGRMIWLNFIENESRCPGCNRDEWFVLQ